MVVGSENAFTKRPYVAVKLGIGVEEGKKMSEFACGWDKDGTNIVRRTCCPCAQKNKRRRLIIIKQANEAINPGCHSGTRGL